mgnify:FL=1
MSDYTMEELEQMLAEKQDEFTINQELEITASAQHKFELDLSNVIKSSDYEFVSHKTNDSFNTCIARVYKSETQNKQIIETYYYWNETKNNELVARAKTSASFSTGSYGESYTTPTLQILGTREKDLTILRG